MDRRTALVVVLTILLCSTGVGAVTEFPTLQTGDVETDTVVLEAAVDADGDARWSLEYRVALDDENTTAAFESLQRDIGENTSDYRDQFASRMRSTVSAAENATGREMRIANVSVTAQTSPLSGEYGVVRYSFSWEGFAATDGDGLAVGDALAGIFLDEDTELTISWPESHEPDVIEPEPDREGEDSVTWSGPREFGTGEPRVVLRTRNSIQPWAPLVGLLLFGAAGIVWYYRRKQATKNADALSESSEEGGTVVGADEREAERGGEGSGERPNEPESRGGSTTTVSDETAAAGSAASGDDQREAPEELLRPEERVIGLLEENGGRMKQKVVTEELDWSAARTSQVVSSLRDEGKVESFRLGRENVLKFPDDEETP